MIRPLYKEADRLDSLPPGGHAGLWYDKFCDEWQLSGNSWAMSSDGLQNPKLRWIEKVTGRVGTKTVGEHAIRIARLIDGCGGRFSVFSSCSRFVTGLGRSHPVENGFAWHTTLGTPFLPGSSIKGMVRAWAKSDQVNVDRLLGSRNSDSAGLVSFLDALPVRAVTVEADIMTPHYGNWTLDNLPGDWCSPTPIPFLTVAQGSKMLFGVVPRLGADVDDLTTVMEWIAKALAWNGLGAKTAVGYGRFERDKPEERRLRSSIEEANRKREESRRRADLRPIHSDIEEIVGCRPDTAMRPSTAIFHEAKNGRWSGGDLREVAKWLKAEMKRDKTWRREKRKPLKAHKRTLQVICWLDKG